MYFPAFSRTVSVPLPEETIFTVEYFISQILLTGNQDFLAKSLEQGKLIDGLTSELHFLGKIPKSQEDAIKSYLIHQEQSLSSALQTLLKKPISDEIYKYFLTPMVEGDPYHSDGSIKKYDLHLTTQSPKIDHTSNAKEDVVNFSTISENYSGKLAIKLQAYLFQGILNIAPVIKGWLSDEINESNIEVQTKTEDSIIGVL